MAEQSPSDVVAQALITLAANLLEPVGEAVDGYRADLIRRGYSPTAAEVMTIEYHKLLFWNLMDQNGAAK